MTQEEYIKTIKQRYKDALLDKSFIIAVCDYQISKNNAFIKDDKAIEDEIKQNQEEYNDILQNKLVFSNSEEENEKIINNYANQYLTKEGLINNAIVLNKELEKSKNTLLEIFEDDSYKNSVNNLIYDETLNNDLFIGCYELIVDILNNVIAEFNKTIDESTINKLKWAFNIQKEINNKLVNKLDQKQDDKDINFKQFSVKTHREYNDKHYIASSQLLNNMSVIKRKKTNNAVVPNFNNREDLNNYLLNNFDFVKTNIKLTSSSDLNKTIELTEDDREVLQAILKVYDEGQETFDDTKIANEVYNPRGFEVEQYQRDAVNNSILKLSNVYIGQGFESEQEYKNAKVKINYYDRKLIEVGILEIITKNNYKSYKYKFKNMPPYKRYLVDNGIEIKETSRHLLTNRIKGVKKTKEEQGLKGFIIERLVNNSEFIYLSDIYKILDIKEENYKSRKAYINARSDAIVKTKNILNAYMNEKEFNFEYEAIKEGKTITYFLIKKPSSEDQKEQN